MHLRNSTETVGHQPFLFKQNEKSSARKFDRDISRDPHNTDVRDVDRQITWGTWIVGYQVVD